MNLRKLDRELENLTQTDRMPAVFIGHGSPMNAIELNTYSQSWIDLAKNLPAPKAILSVSAHWITPGSVQVLAEPQPRTIHDFGGFPDVLYEQQYTAPGSPSFAELTAKLLQDSHAQLDHKWGFDHGTWSILKHMYPEADIPVYQVSIDYSKPPLWHYALAQQLSKLRDKGVLIMGSGNVVHNLRAIVPGARPFDWALEFDAKIAAALENGDDQTVVDFLELGELAKAAHPTHDHFLPLLYTIGSKDSKEGVQFVTGGFDFGSISMRSFVTN